MNEHNADSCSLQENFEATTGGFTCGKLASITYDDVYFLLSGLSGGKYHARWKQLIHHNKDDENDTIVSISLYTDTVEISS